ncbi:Hypothetical protein D9617_19g102720 [Elsinoe fawcettii]|nr:Hypothetical protein D9617_19g102720 [Elsinoe fawcettii]
MVERNEILVEYRNKCAAQDTLKRSITDLNSELNTMKQEHREAENALQRRISEAVREKAIGDKQEVTIAQKLDTNEHHMNDIYRRSQAAANAAGRLWRRHTVSQQFGHNRACTVEKYYHGVAAKFRQS